MLTVHLFAEHPDVLETYRRRFRHVLVDEYQDTNHAQYALIHQLCAADLEERPDADGPRAEPAELMVVGDADQSIYAFRGASIRNILDFEDDFPDARTILLEQNYRSTQTILTAANAVISRNEGRKDKTLWSDAGDGERIVGYVADDEHDESRFVAGEIKHARRGRGGAGRGRGRVLPHQRPVPRLRGDVHPDRAALPRGRRRPLLRAARDPGRAGLPAAARQPGRRDLAAADHQRAQAGHRRPRHRVRPGLRRAGAADVLGGAAPRRRGARHRHPVPDPDARLRGDDRGAPVDGRRRRACRRRSSRPSSSAPATSRRSRSRPTRRTRPGRRTSPSWSRSPASSARTRWPGRRRTRPTSTPASSSRGSRTSWSGSRWSPTPTRSPTTRTASSP